MYYKTMGKKLMLKADVVPHKYLKRSATVALSPVLSDSAKKRKAITMLLTDSLTDIPSTSYTNLEEQQILRNIELLGSPVEKTSEVISAAAPSSSATKWDSPLSSTTKWDSPSSSSEFILSSTESSVCESEIDELSLRCFKENRRQSTIELIKIRSQFYLGLPKYDYGLVSFLENRCRLNYVNVLITLKKIRTNDSHSRLADDFGISKTRVGIIFQDSVPKLSKVMWHFVYFPSTEIVRKSLPIPFRYRYNNVISIIDCLEIEILKPSDPVQQSMTWSDYKKCNTVKYLVSCTPHGFINFISRGYGGRASDKEIFEKSGIINHIPENVSIMADRGFKQIESSLLKKNINLVRPPSVASDQKSSKDEIRKTKQIAALRIHVERVISRIREFEMLHMHSCLKLDFIPLINSIIIIACAIINMQTPVL